VSSPFTLTTLLVLSSATWLPAPMWGQSPTKDIELAVLAAPAPMREGATVLDLLPDGTTAVQRQGANGLICWNNEGRSGAMDSVDVQCTSEGNRPRLEQNHAFEAAGGTVNEIQARFRRAEEDGTRVLPVWGSIYYRAYGASADDLRTHTTVSVPFATQESLGFSITRGPAVLWLMEAGTSGAHLMVSGM
jgi:hypothetical protein